jgi:hypothetical protein
MDQWQNMLPPWKGTTPKVSRRVFFSFHYKPDVQRAKVVANSWLTKPDREEAGFFNASAFESKQRQGDEVLKDFLRDALKGTTITCVLIGAETAVRPWVRYELVRSFHRGNGLLGIRVHKIQDFRKPTSLAGPNPFDQIAYRVIDNRVYWQELNNGTWSDYTKVPSMVLSDVPYDLENQLYHTFATRFRVYDWVTDNGYENLGNWVQRAATQAGK